VCVPDVREAAELRKDRPLLSPKATSSAATVVMRGNRRRDTRPEMAIRSEVHRRGLRYRVDNQPILDLRRRADLVFRSAKVAVFVDGCLWHGCPEHCRVPETHREYWSEKIDRNMRRDLDTDRRLRKEGWVSIRIWEHDDPEEAAAKVADVVSVRSRSSSSPLRRA